MSDAQKPDAQIVEEFNNATRERQIAAVANMRIETTCAQYRDAVTEIVRRAAAIGLQIEVTTVSLWPPAMGHVESQVEVRPKLALWRDIERLEYEARVSEMTDTQAYAEWMKQHQHAARAEGWALVAYHDMEPAFQVQRIIGERLASDDEAKKLLVAGFGDHYSFARRFLQQHAPTEWDRCLRVARGDKL